MNSERRKRTLVLAAVLAVALALILLAPAAADAQCAMCKTGVQAGGEQAARTMRAGMLVLLIPPVAIFCTIFAVFFKYRNGGDAATSTDRETHGRR